MSSLECPFDHGKCGFKTIEESEYADHTKVHEPNILPMDESLVKVRIAIAKGYAEDNGKPVNYAGHLWVNKPAKMDCGTMTAIIQDHGIVDDDNFAGLSMSTSGELQRSKPYQNPFKRRNAK